MNRPPYQTNHPAVVKQQYDTHNVWAFENPWRSELFDCKPWGQCCFACFCSCCMQCKMAKYLGESSWIGCCPGSLLYMRTKLRTARRIPGTCCGDSCASNFCGPCVANQIANELKSQGLWDIQKSRKTRPQQDRYNNQNNDYN